MSALREVLGCLRPARERRGCVGAAGRRETNGGDDLTTEPGFMREDTAYGGGGRALIYTWALEQKTSRRGWDENHEQDVMVPWVMQGQKKKKKKKEGSKHGDVEGGSGGARGDDEDGGKEEDTVTLNRYYHLYREGELNEDIREAGGTVVESGFERDNWWAVAVRYG